MPRTTWKEVRIDNMDDWWHLQEWLGDMYDEWRDYVISYEGPVSILRTNLPWSELRWWFARCELSHLLNQ